MSLVLRPVAAPDGNARAFTGQEPMSAQIARLEAAGVEGPGIPHHERHSCRATDSGLDRGFRRVGQVIADGGRIGIR